MGFPTCGASLTDVTLTVAGTAATAILKTLIALRFERVVRIDSHEDLRFRPRTIASILTQYVLEQVPQDVLLLGRQTIIGENARTHLLAAEMLKWPCITHVTGIQLDDKNHLTVTSQTDDGLLQQQIDALETRLGLTHSPTQEPQP